MAVQYSPILYKVNRTPVRRALEGVKVHRAHVRDVETVHTIHLAHERGLFSMKKRCPLMSAVTLHNCGKSPMGLRYSVTCGTLYFQ